MPRIVRFAATGMLVFVVTMGALLPWAVYWIGLEGIDGRPDTIANERSADEVKTLWAAHEPNLPQGQLGSISPYWMYYWLSCGFHLQACDWNKEYGGMSKMAGFVALTYMRDGHFRGKGMAHWHLTAVCLTIWIQRNMSSSDIVTAYVEAQAHYQRKG